MYRKSILPGFIALSLLSSTAASQYRTHGDHGT